MADHPGQVVLTAGQILWTAECERALCDAEAGPRRALKALRNKWVAYLAKLTTMTRGRLEPVDRAKVGSRREVALVRAAGAQRLAWVGGVPHQADCKDVPLAIASGPRQGGRDGGVRWV